MKALRNNQKGFTLVEISVGFLILAIIMGMTLSLLLFTTNIFRQSVEGNSSKMIADKAHSMISEELIYATHLEIVESRADAHYEKIIEIVDGQLYFGSRTGPSNNVFGESTYGNRTIQLITTKEDSSLLSLQLEIIINGKTDYKTGSSIKILNFAMPDASQSIKTVLDTMENPVISYDYIPYAVVGEDEANTEPTPEGGGESGGESGDHSGGGSESTSDPSSGGDSEGSSGESGSSGGGNSSESGEGSGSEPGGENSGGSSGGGSSHRPDGIPPGTVMDQIPEDPDLIADLREGLSCGPNPVPIEGAYLYVRDPETKIIYKVMYHENFTYQSNWHPSRMPNMWKKMFYIYDELSRYEAGDIIRFNNSYFMALEIISTRTGHPKCCRNVGEKLPTAMVNGIPHK